VHELQTDLELLSANRAMLLYMRLPVVAEITDQMHRVLDSPLYKSCAQVGVAADIYTIKAHVWPVKIQVSPGAPVPQSVST